MTDADDIDGGRDDKGEGWERHNATASLLQHGLSETLIGAFEALGCSAKCLPMLADFIAEQNGLD